MARGPASGVAPLTYYHVVFTLPESLARLALHNARVIYNLLFRAVSETLLRIAADPKHLGARIGFFAVLRMTFTWKDHCDGDKTKEMTLQAEEFIRRFLLHVLPDGFQKIRYFGWMANRQHAANLALCRSLLPDAQQPVSPLAVKDWKERYRELTGEDVRLCPACKRGRLMAVRILNPLTSSPLMRNTVWLAMTPRETQIVWPLNQSSFHDGFECPTLAATIEVCSEGSRLACKRAPIQARRDLIEAQFHHRRHPWSITALSSGLDHSPPDCKPDSMPI